MQINDEDRYDIILVNAVMSGVEGTDKTSPPLIAEVTDESERNTSISYLNYITITC